MSYEQPEETITQTEIYDTDSPELGETMAELYERLHANQVNGAIENGISGLRPQPISQQ